MSQWYRLKCGQTKQKVLAIHVNPSGPPPPFPSYYTNTRKRTLATHTYTRTHTYTNQMPYSQHPRDDLQTVFSIQTNPNLQQWKNWCRCINHFLVYRGHFISFTNDSNYVYTCNPNLNLIFSQHSRSPLFVASKILETTSTARRLAGRQVSTVLNSISLGFWSPPWTETAENTQVIKYCLWRALGSSSFEEGGVSTRAQRGGV